MSTTTSHGAPSDETPWLELAHELSLLIATAKIRHMNVYGGRSFGENCSILRVWGDVVSSASEKESHILATLAFTTERVACSAREHGLTIFELINPNSINQIIAWMRKVGLTE